MAHYIADETLKSVIYSLEPEEVPDVDRFIDKRARRDGFLPKYEHHITVIPLEIGSRLLRPQFKELQELVLSFEGVAAEFNESLYRIEKPKITNGNVYPRQALVTPVESEDLRNDLGTIFDEFKLWGKPFPFLHVTMYTQPSTEIAMRGIGISSSYEWNDLQPEVYAEHWQKG